jgi:3-methyladenine DNA glycosylase AlkD
VPVSRTTADRAARIERELAAHANPARIAVMAGGYAPSGLCYLGAAVPDLRRVVRAWSQALRHAPARDVLDLALALARRGTVEGRQAGYELLARRRDAMARLTPALVRRLGRGNDNWASVDGFATHVTGRAWRDGRLTDAEILRWARSRDRWWRRTALASTVALNVRARGGAGDRRRTLLICRVFSRETDPMLAKALSWALRSLAPHDPSAVGAYLAAHTATLPAIVTREVATKLRTGRKSVRRSRRRDVSAAPGRT